MPDNIEFLERIKRLTIVAMFSDDTLMERLVLKGGNLLDIVYRISTRSSVDVDFSIDGEFDSLDDFQMRVSRSLQRTFREAGFEPFDINVRAVPAKLSEDRKDFWGGYKIHFKIIEHARFDEFRHDLDTLRRNALSVGKRGSTKFTIDVSKHEYCGDKVSRPLEGYTIFGHSPEMLVCEKLRAICQQMPEYVKFVESHPSARARDFLDIHTVAEHFSIDFDDEKFQTMVRGTFDAKRVPLRLIGEIHEYRDYHRADFSGVAATVKPGVKLQEFDYYFEYVLDKCDHLKALWNE